MPEDWTLERLVAFAMGLSTLEHLGPAALQELGEGLAFLVALQAEFRQVIRDQAETIQTQAIAIQTQADTFQHQADTIERLHEALQYLQAGVLLLGEAEAP